MNIMTGKNTANQTAASGDFRLETVGNSGQVSEELCGLWQPKGKRQTKIQNLSAIARQDSLVAVPQNGAGRGGFISQNGRSARRAGELPHKAPSTIETPIENPRILVREVEALILQYLPQRLSEGFLSNTFKVDLSFLRMSFRKVRGADTQAAFRTLRISEVKRRLDADSELSVELAMHQCGFGSFSGFSREFKQRFGMNPKDFCKSREEVKVRSRRAVASQHGAHKNA